LCIINSFGYTIEVEETKKAGSTKEKLRNLLIGLGVIAFLGWGFYGMFIKHSNEVGFLGMDKVGRQVFIQTLDGYFHPNIDVESEFNDQPLPIRLIVGEPLRTTLRFNIQDEQEFKATPESVDAFLAQPASEITSQYKGKITMQDDYEVTPDELLDNMKEKEVKTVADLLSGFGFKSYEVLSRGELVKTIQLPRTKNVAHVGGD